FAVRVAPGAEQGDRAGELYNTHCAPCHGRDGKARTPIGRKIGVKDLTASRVPDAEIEKQIHEGRKDTRGNERMPAFHSKLTDDEIKSLVPIVKRFRK
ncbi:MAG TPA: cytochrome c, partial [Verrucomicrobiae bacterium]